MNGVRTREGEGNLWLILYSLVVPSHHVVESWSGEEDDLGCESFPSKQKYGPKKGGEESASRKGKREMGRRWTDSSREGRKKEGRRTCLFLRVRLTRSRLGIR